MNWLFLSTSHKDVAFALQQYFTDNYGLNTYDSAGISPYLSEKRGGDMVTETQIKAADVLCFVSDIHYKRAVDLFNIKPGADPLQVMRRCSVIILNVPVFVPGMPMDDYLLTIDETLRSLVSKKMQVSDMRLITKGATPYYPKAK